MAGDKEGKYLGKPFPIEDTTIQRAPQQLELYAYVRCGMELLARGEGERTVKVGDTVFHIVTELKVGDEVWHAAMFGGWWKFTVTSYDPVTKSGLGENESVMTSIEHSSSQPNDDRDCFISTGAMDKKILEMVDFS